MVETRIKEKNGGNNLKVELLKLKNIVIDRYKILIPIIGIMLVLSALWIFETSMPVYENKVKNVSTYKHYGFYSYTVPVTRENPLYPVGTTLKMGMPAYFFVVSPTVNMSFTYRVESADSSEIHGKLETFIVATVRGVSASKEFETSGSETDGSEANESTKEEIFWEKEFPLNSEAGSITWDGPSVTKNFSLNVIEIQSQVKDLQKQMNYSTTPKIEIVNRVSYTGKVHGKDAQITKDFAIPLEIKEYSYFKLPEKLDFTQNTNITENLLVESKPPLPKTIPPLLLCLLSLVLLGTTLVCGKMGKVEPEVIEKMEKEEKRSSFKDFISRGKLPQDRNSLLQIEISSLQELIDAASDMNSRVINDERADTYFVINNGIMYIFLDKSEKNIH
jgi:hypothetical protein